MNFSAYFSLRLILCIPLLTFGIFHLIQSFVLSPAVQCVLPGDVRWWIMALGISLILSAGIIAAKKFEKEAALSIALVLSFFVAVIYAPNLGSSDSHIKISSMLNMGKDMVLAGGALAYAGIVSVKL